MDRNREKKLRKEDAEKEKAMKKRKMDSGNYHTPNPTNIMFLDNLVLEIMLRLPIKSLMRFKSVSKHWQYFIQHDSHFHDLYFTRSKNNPKNNPMLLFRISEHETSLSSMHLRECAADSETHKVLTNDLCTLKPVNGLICFRETCNQNSIILYNLSTREERKLGTLEEDTKIMESFEEFDSHSFEMYGLGFDPISKVYKAIRLWYVYPKDDIQVKKIRFCEVFTIGKDTCWRRIDVRLPCDVGYFDYIYANGFIFWRPCGHTSYDMFNFILAFDVRNETIKMISIPIPLGSVDHLLEVDGCLAILEIDRTQKILKMWILREEEDKSSNWIEEIIHFNWKGNDWVFQVEAIQGTNLIIIGVRQVMATCEIDVHHHYDRKKKTSELVQILDPCSSFTSFIPSLFPVQK